MDSLRVHLLKVVNRDCLILDSGSCKGRLEVSMEDKSRMHACITMYIYICMYIHTYTSIFSFYTVHSICTTYVAQTLETQKSDLGQD